ncbi:MAG: helix-turn-helix domain-containing protein [Candidatus Nanoarchaeia archaeon]|nr:helix-turn-helix domain-containing protein [Candidatus Nanoarchaeia archaeon]MDD5588247.1 helix-turn-helix domain-containing protein [Candidatus Nanoarchaeia archaeon]
MIELKRLGLTENETKVYSALLELGSCNAGKIIKKTKLHRNIVYDNLEKLIDKGLVSYITVKGIKRFETTNPIELKNYIERQKQDILEKERLVNEILPQIEKKREIIEREDASIFKGKKAIINILEEITESKTEILIFATGWGMKETMGTYYKQWHLKLKQNKIYGRALLSKKTKLEEEFPYKMRYISEEFILPATIVIYENKVLNIIWKSDLMGILIVNKDVSDSYRKWFEVLWKVSK